MNAQTSAFAGILAERIERLWADGWNSFAIGQAVGLPEADVCRILRRQQEARHAQRQTQRPLQASA